MQENRLASSTGGANEDSSRRRGCIASVTLFEPALHLFETVPSLQRTAVADRSLGGYENVCCSKQIVCGWIPDSRCFFRRSMDLSAKYCGDLATAIIGHDRVGSMLRTRDCSPIDHIQKCAYAIAVVCWLADQIPQMS